MDISDQIVTLALMAVFTLLLGWFGRGQFRSLKEEMTTVRAEIGAVEDRLGARIDRVETSLGARIDKVENELVALRSDLTQVALAVGVRPRAENG